MYRDNNKELTPRLSASKSGSDSTLKGAARPGSRNHKVASGAGDVGSVNGKTPRPGYKQKSVKAGGSGTVARPGFAQGIGKG